MTSCGLYDPQYDDIVHVFPRIIDTSGLDIK